MNVKKCYEEFDGDYDTIVYLLKNEERIAKYLKKFVEDKSMEKLTNALQESNQEDAFLYAHTLKGLSMNLAMNNLIISSSNLTEALRSKETDIQHLYHQVELDYQKIITAIKLYILDQDEVNMV